MPRKCEDCALKLPTFGLTAAANKDTAVAELSGAAKEDLIAKIAADARSSEYEGDDDDKNEFACPWPGCSYIALRRSHLVSQIHRIRKELPALPRLSKNNVLFAFITAQTQHRLTHTGTYTNTHGEPFERYQNSARDSMCTTEMCSSLCVRV